ncbi:Dig-1p [Globodera pallida]|nr:Dig-1p [Globodera pallida]
MDFPTLEASFDFVDTLAAERGGGTFEVAKKSGDELGAADQPGQTKSGQLLEHQMLLKMEEYQKEQRHNQMEICVQIGELKKLVGAVGTLTEQSRAAADQALRANVAATEKQHRKLLIDHETLRAEIGEMKQLQKMQEQRQAQMLRRMGELGKAFTGGSVLLEKPNSGTEVGTEAGNEETEVGTEAGNEEREVGTEAGKEGTEDGSQMDASSAQMRASAAAYGQMQPSGAPYGQMHASGAPYGQMQASCAPYGHMQASGAPYGQTQASCAPYGQMQASAAPYGQMQASAAPYGQMHASGAPYGQMQASAAPYGQMHASGAPYGQMHASGAPYGQMQASAAPYGQMLASGAPYGQMQASAAPYGQMLASGAPYDQMQASGAPYGQMQASGAPYGQTQASGAPYGQMHASGAPYGQMLASGAPYGQMQASAAPYGQTQASALMHSASSQQINSHLNNCFMDDCRVCKLIKLLTNGIAVYRRWQKTLTPHNRWDVAACCKGLTLIEPKRLIVQCDGEFNDLCCYVFAERPILKDVGFFYYELKFLQNKGSICIGLASKQMPFEGDSAVCKGVNVYLALDAVPGDVVGYSLSLETREIVYTRNGVRLDSRNVLPHSAVDLFPYASLPSLGDKVEANFGPNFLFNIHYSHLKLD